MEIINKKKVVEFNRIGLVSKKHKQKLKGVNKMKHETPKINSYDSNDMDFFQNIDKSELTIADKFEKLFTENESHYEAKKNEDAIIYDIERWAISCNAEAVKNFIDALNKEDKTSFLKGVKYQMIAIADLLMTYFKPCTITHYFTKQLNINSCSYIEMADDIVTPEKRMNTNAFTKYYEIGRLFVNIVIFAHIKFDRDFMEDHINDFREYILEHHKVTLKNDK